MYTPDMVMLLLMDINIISENIWYFFGFNVDVIDVIGEIMYLDNNFKSGGYGYKNQGLEVELKDLE